MLIPYDVLLTYCITCVILAISPGPDIIFVLTQSALQGRKAGFFVVLGLCTGVLFHTMLVAFGVAIIFKTSELAFTALKVAGAAYLLYLAWGAFRAGAETIDSSKNTELSYGTLFRRGIFMSSTNPKVSVFFLAFLPQFADPARGSVTAQMIILGLVFIACAFTVFCCVAYGAGYLGEWLNRSKRVQQWINRAAGAVFTGLAIKLLLTQR